MTFGYIVVPLTSCAVVFAPEPARSGLRPARRDTRRGQECDVPAPVPDERRALDLEVGDHQFSRLAVRDRSAFVVQDLDDHEIRVGVQDRNAPGTRERPIRPRQSVGGKELSAPRFFQQPAQGIRAEIRSPDRIPDQQGAPRRERLEVLAVGARLARQRESSEGTATSPSGRNCFMRSRWRRAGCAPRESRRRRPWRARCGTPAPPRNRLSRGDRDVEATARPRAQHVNPRRSFSPRRCRSACVMAT